MGVISILKERSRRGVKDRVKDMLHGGRMLENTQEDIGNNNEEVRGEGVTLSQPIAIGEC